jgi:hypothetical protein
MRNVILLLCAVFFLGIAVSFAQQGDTKSKDSKGADALAPIPPEDADAAKKNPVKLTPEGFGEAKVRWNLVNVVRSFGKAPAAAAAK